MKVEPTLPLLALNDALEKQAGLGSLLWGGTKLLGKGLQLGGKGLWAGSKLALKSPIYAFKGLRGVGMLTKTHPWWTLGTVMGLGAIPAFFKPQEMSGPTTFDGRMTPGPLYGPGKKDYFDMTNGRGWAPS